MKSRLMPILAVVALALTGCTASPVKANESPAPVTSPATPSPTPTAAPSPPLPSESPEPAAAEDPAEPATWTIGFDGIGPVAIGQTREEAIAALAAFPVGPLEGCPAPIDAVDLGSSEIWLTDDVLTALVLRQPPLEPDPTGQPRTEEGITVGSTIDELLAAYPSAQQSPLGDYSVDDGTGRWLHFLGLNGTIYTIVINRFPTAPKEYCS